MTRLSRTALFSATLAVASLSAVFLPLAASAAAPDDTRALHAAHVERMQRIGRTPRYDELPASPSAARLPADAEARQRAWETRQRLAGRTPLWNERAPAEPAPDAPARDAADALARYKARATAAGRTVQWHEWHAQELQVARTGHAAQDLAGLPAPATH
ncbi:hypothetical protein [Rhizobacter sp. LjRoot28]|uniref:hypothetical protein n=1 Tax=Rhizobacter sp. LjRoot28 TaxID=3342309 RepID=UPI003ECDC6AF